MSFKSEAPTKEYDPGEKYRDKVSPEHKMAIEAIDDVAGELGASGD